MLKEKADLQSVVYIITTSVLLVVLWTNGENLTSPLWWLIYGVYLHLSVAVSVMVHNHKHVPMWKNKWLNVLTDNWLTVFYGFPVFAWVPTHMINHHVHVNTEKDYTRTWRYTEKNNLLTLITYPTLSGKNQQPAVKSYYFSQWKKDRSKFWFLTLQLASLFTWLIAAFVIDWYSALIYVVIPQQVSLFSVLIFNYVQHIHTDEKSEYNNCRNFTGWGLNTFLLNNGYHTAHHMAPGLHWSKLKTKHEEVNEKIDQNLNENSFWWFIGRTYVLGMVFSKLRTQNMRSTALSDT
ncbi:MAG: fatty acid desaturase family protein [Flavobacteriales bacterium]